VFRVATWNLGHAVHSKKPFRQQWEWFEENVTANLVVFSEAKPDFSLCGSEWSFVFKEGGIGGRRRWGTAIGSYGLDLRDVTNGVSGRQGFKIEHRFPGYVSIADVLDENELPVLTVVGIHAPLVDLSGKKIKRGDEALGAIMEDLQDLFRSERGESLIIAGDLNVHPFYVPPSLYEDFVDLVEATAESRDPLPGCVNCGMGSECGHLWTHRNTGGKNPTVQNLDYIFVSESLMDDLFAVVGGDLAYPDVWDYSDHAPVVADFGDMESE